MPVTVQNIVDDAQTVHLGDEQSEVFDDTYLLGYFAFAYRQVLNDIRMLGNRIVRRRSFTRLAVNGPHYIVPGSPDLPDLGTSVVNLGVRREASFTSINVPATTLDSQGIPTFTTTSPHGRVVGDFVQVTGLVGNGNPNYEGLVTAVPSTTQVTLAIPILPAAVPTTSAQGAGISYATDAWFNLLEESHNTFFPYYVHRFENGRYVFEPLSTAARQVMFEYYMEPNSKTFTLTDIVAEERARDVIALRLALVAGKNKVDLNFYQQIFDDYGLAKTALESALVRDSQRQIVQRPRHHTVVTRRRWA